MTRRECLKIMEKNNSNKKIHMLLIRLCTATGIMDEHLSPEQESIFRQLHAQPTKEAREAFASKQLMHRLSGYKNN